MTRENETGIVLMLRASVGETIAVLTITYLCCLLQDIAVTIQERWAGTAESELAV